ncbi:MAG TPA: hypothetical protein VG826_34580 [Pirellulales bacterium]|nr:hypothetical protein [Pirellulales bacterium]
MCARANIEERRKAVHASIAGWRELDAALKGGVPYAAEIVKQLDSAGVRFPAAPSFDLDRTDLRCYRLIHQIWREGLLPKWLGLLQRWRLPEGSLCEGAQHPGFQQALFEFLREHLWEGLPVLLECLMQESPWRTAPAGGGGTIESLRCGLEALWTQYCHQRAA